MSDDPDEQRYEVAATCSIADACRLLGWSTSKVQRRRELRAPQADPGRLSLDAVLRERNEILDHLDAVDRAAAKLDQKKAVEEQAVETERWRQAFEELRVAHIGLARSIGNISGLHTAADLANGSR